MTAIDQLAGLHAEMTSWRRHLHANPETAFEEHDTAAFVAERLRSFGLAVDRGLAGTGVVGTLSVGHGPAIALRADMDALPIQEENEFAHRSTRLGKMHACGHDGHTAMLLGAARYLAATRRFGGTVHFVFQPAEENEAGGRLMVEQGLFEKFPVSAVYGLHNWPGLPAGRIALRSGPMMAACDLFEVVVSGRGCHAAMPHLGNDVVLAASSIVAALHSLVGRMLNPFEAAVMSITQVHAGDTWNVLPRDAMLRGTVRSFKPAVQDALETAIRHTAEAVALGHRCRADVRYEQRYPATVNDPEATGRARRAAALVVGEAGLETRSYPEYGLRRLRLHAARAARLLRLAWQRPHGGRLCAAQCEVRFQRRHPAHRGRLLGYAR